MYSWVWFFGKDRAYLGCLPSPGNHHWPRKDLQWIIHDITVENERKPLIYCVQESHFSAFWLLSHRLLSYVGMIIKVSMTLKF